MICPATGRLCEYLDCKEEGCEERRIEDDEDEIETDTEEKQ